MARLLPLFPLQLVALPGNPVPLHIFEPRYREMILGEDLTPVGDRKGSDRHDDPMQRFAEVVRDVVTGGEVPPGVPTFADGVACDIVLDQLRAPPIVTRA